MFKKTFTLVEIMIVVTIIIILALLVVPNMLRAKVTSNEATTIANLKGIYTALQIYYNDNNKAYPQTLALLSEYIGSTLASGSKSGYLFNYTYENEDTFYIKANPRTPGRTGTRYFYMDETGTIRANSQGEASETDPITE